MSIINEGEETQQQIVRLKHISEMELNRFNNFDFKLAEADQILKEANRIYEETAIIANQKSEALELYNEYLASDALTKHELFVKKAKAESDKIKSKADDILKEIE